MKADPGKTNRNSRLVWLVVCLSGLIAACGQDAPVEQAEVARPIKMMNIGADDEGRTLEIPGSVGAAQSAELSFEVSGRMLARMVEEGQIVEAGQVVAKLDVGRIVSRMHVHEAESQSNGVSRYDRVAEKLLGEHEPGHFEHIRSRL